MLDRHHWKVRNKIKGRNPSNKFAVYFLKKYKNLGKLTLGKGRGPGFWFQYQGDITNLNVFG